MFYCNSYTPVPAHVDNLWSTSIIHVSTNLYEHTKGKGQSLFQLITQMIFSFVTFLYCLHVILFFFRFNLTIVGSKLANLMRLKLIFTNMTSSAAHKKIFYFFIERIIPADLRPGWHTSWGLKGLAISQQMITSVYSSSPFVQFLCLTSVVIAHNTTPPPHTINHSCQ